MRLVYFSLISEEKGAQLTIDAAKELSDCSFSFYGPIDAQYEKKFLREVERLHNVEYRGVFDSVAGDVVSELNQYDIHLFPTMCPNEGVPGVVVETKLAAVPTIASNRGYNCELINNGKDGVLTSTDTVDELVGVISSLATSPEQLNSMKGAALLSSDFFYVERYLDMICDVLQEG